MYRLSVEDIFEEFKKCYPNLIDRVVGYHELNESVIEIIFADGCRWKYYGGTSGAFRVIKDYDGSKEDWSKHFSHNLIDIMNHRGIDQTYLSELSGVSQQSISNYINGKGMPTGYVIDRLAKALHCNVSDLVGF